MTSYYLTPLPQTEVPLIQSLTPQRRRLGLFFGLGLCLTFGVVAHWINPLLLEGRMIFIPPFGLPTNLILLMVLGAGSGLLCAWYETMGRSLLWASLFSTIIVMLVALVTSAGGSAMLGGRVMAVLTLFLPMAGAVLPFVWGLRVLVNWQVERLHEPRFAPRRWWLSALAFLLAAGLGCLTLYPARGQTMIRQADVLIQAGLSAQTPQDLPEALREPGVRDFLGRATPQYTLQRLTQNLDLYHIPTYYGQTYRNELIVVRFNTGWAIGCLYQSEGNEIDPQPECRSYARFTAPYLRESEQ
ncbi:MAG: hypothetical protein LDL12_02725 [Anaerolinea sp.]|nr:hypothetical protein [Anaerolinea sp.]